MCSSFSPLLKAWYVSLHWITITTWNNRLKIVPPINVYIGCISVMLCDLKRAECDSSPTCHRSAQQPICDGESNVDSDKKRFRTMLPQGPPEVMDLWASASNYGAYEAKELMKSQKSLLQERKSFEPFCCWLRLTNEWAHICCGYLLLLHFFMGGNVCAAIRTFPLRSSYSTGKISPEILTVFNLEASNKA